MSKGSLFEREMCRKISLWWTDSEQDDVFWRNRTRITSKTPKKEAQLGDFAATHTIGIPFIETFNVELKIGYARTKKGKKVKIVQWDLLDTIDSKTNRFEEFWKQTTRDAFISNRIPLLIFRRDYHSAVVAMYTKDIRKLEELNGMANSLPYLVVHLTGHDPIELHSFESFFQWLRPDVVRLFFSVKNVPKELRILERVRKEVPGYLQVGLKAKCPTE